MNQDQYLIGVNHESLINTSPDGRQVWIANIDSATAAAEHEKRKWDDTPDSGIVFFSPRGNFPEIRGNFPGKRFQVEGDMFHLELFLGEISPRSI